MSTLRRTIQTRKLLRLSVILFVFLSLWGPVHVKAEDTAWQNDYTYELDKEKGLIRLDHYNGSASELTVPSTAVIDGVEYTVYIEGGSDRKLWYDTGVKKLSFDSGIKLGSDLSYLFYDCSEITALDLSKWDTSNVTSMASTFDSCNSLTDLDLSSFNTSKVKALGSLFNGCSSLETLDLSGFDTSSVTSMGWMFRNCKNLTKVEFGNFNTSNADSLAEMFRNCNNLTNLDLSSFDTAKVKTMSCMFDGCTSLESVDISNFNTENVTNMASMFNSCSSLKNLDLSHFNTSRVTNMAWMFRYCSSLESLDVSSFDTAAATNISEMFRGCSNLTSLDLSNFNTAKVTSLNCMFDHCNSLQSLDISSFDTSKVTTMNSMFNFCSSLKTLDLHNFNTSRVTNMNWMFRICSSLESLDVSSFDTAAVTGMPQMFLECSNLTSLDLSNFNTAKVSSMHNMFYGCNSLQSLDIRSFDTSNVTDMGGMFHACSSLTELDISHFDTGSLTDMDDMLMFCSSLVVVKAAAFKNNGPHLPGRFHDDQYNFYERIPKGILSGTVLTKGCINPSNAKIIVEDQVYTGSPLKPAVKVTLEGKTVPPDNYQLSYSNNTKAGTAKVKVIFSNDFLDFRKEAEFKIKPCDASKALITVKDQVYTGEPLTPDVIVTLNKTVISEDAYTLSYSNNINPGKGIVTVKFKGNYTGTVSTSFTIKGTLLGIAEKDGNQTLARHGKKEYLPVKKNTTLEVREKGLSIVRTRWSLAKKSRKYAKLNRKTGKLKINKKGIGKRIIVYADVYYTRQTSNAGSGMQLSEGAVSRSAGTEHRRLKAVVMSFDKMARVTIWGARTVKINKKLQLRAKGTPVRKHTHITKTFIWTSSNKHIARVSRNGGKVTGIKKGTVTITCKPGDKVSKCKATVKITVK